MNWLDCTFVLSQLLVCWVIFILLLSSADFFFKINLLKKLFQEHYQSGKRMDQDQDRQNVGPSLGQNRLQRLSADDKSPLARKESLRNQIESCYFT